MTRPPETARGRASRTDAKRNRERLLTSARALFAERGADVALHDVAKHAGLGAGTAYRHFPSRETLLDAVLTEHFEALRLRAESLAAAERPGEALLEWLRMFVEHLTTYRGLARESMPLLHDEGAQLGTACRGMREAVSVLLKRAQGANAVRTDIDMPTLLRLASAIAVTAEQVPERAVTLLPYLMDGLRRPDPDSEGSGRPA